MFFGGSLLFVAFLINEWFHPLPFFKPQLFGRRNFAHGLMTLACAVVLLTGVAAIPGQYLAHIHGYRPLQTTPLFLLVAIPLLIRCLRPPPPRTSSRSITVGSWRSDFA